MSKDKKPSLGLESPTLSLPDKAPDQCSEQNQDPAHKRLLQSYLLKVDLHLLPISFMVYFFSVIDRNNIGNAKLAGMPEHLNLHGQQFNWIVSSFFFTYIFFEIPSNYCLRQLGARVWLPVITIAWSVLVACMACAKSYGALVAVRVLMGCFEAGYVPGFIYLCSFWYTRKQIAPRLALFFSAGMFAGIWAGPLAARLQKIKGGLEGYQYIFLIEAAITVGLALIMWLVLDNYPETARFLTAEERAAGLRMLSEDKGQSARAPFRPQQVLRALSDWTLWGYAVIFWASALGGATQAIFGPTLIAAMGYESTHAQVLSAIPSACGFVVQIASMFFPRIHSRYSPWIMVCSGLACAFYAVIASVESTRVRFAFLCLANAALSPNMPLVSMWMSMNVLGVTKKGVAAAVTVMFGGVSGLIGAHVYRERDYPRYRFGHIFVCACNALIFLVALAMQLYFRWENRRRDKKAGGGVVVVDGSAMSENVIEETDDKRPDHRYTW